MLSSPDAELLEREQALPGLRVLLDFEAFGDILRSELPGIDLRGAASHYLRYKPETSCLVGYQLQIGETTIDAYARAYRSDSQNKLTKSKARSSLCSPFETGSIVRDDLSLVISLFPNDRRLKSLARLSDSHAREKLLQKLFPHQSEFWQGSLRRLSYKPERRYVAQLSVDGEPAAVLRFATGAGYRAARQSSKGLASRGCLRLARRIGRSNHHNIVAVEWLEGELLSEMFSEAAPLAATVANVGVALAELHTQNSRRLQTRTRLWEANNLNSLADDLVVLCPKLSTSIRGVAGKIAERLADLPVGNRFIHGDFYASQVLVEADTIAILDLDEAVCGDPATDLGNFIARLEYDRILGLLSDDRLTQLQSALVDGYRSRLNSIDTNRVLLLTAACLLRLSPLPFRNRDHEWPRQIAEIVARADTILNSATKQYVSNPSSTTRVDVSEIDVSETRVTDRFLVSEDAEMPFLNDAMDPASIQRLFALRLPNVFEEGGYCLRDVCVIRHKPGRRCLIEYNFNRKNSGKPDVSMSLIGKARAKGIDRSNIKLMMSLWKNGLADDSSDGISIPKPLGAIPEFEMWFQQKVAGLTGTRALAEPGGVQVAARIADAIHKLHRMKSVASRRCHTVSDELQILHDRLSSVAQMHPEWENRLRRLLESCDKLALALPVPVPCGVHRDFYPEQVIVDDDRIYLIDFDLYCEGDPALDVGNFIGHLIEYALRTRGSADALFDLTQAFEQRYLELSGSEGRSEAESRTSIDAYTTLTLARHVSLSTQFAERRQTTARLLDLCEERLAIASGCN